MTAGRAGGAIRNVVGFIVVVRLFLNFRLMYESTSIQLPSLSTDVDGVTGTVGIGFSL